jgi:Holliday junction resolvasome RuvABC ATP-dependent DNA helicase subunit
MGFYKLEENLLSIIADRCKLTPRIAKVLCERLKIFFNAYGIPEDPDTLKMLLNDRLLIGEKGLTELDNRYLNFLRSVGRNISLQNIIIGAQIDKETILTEIEPHLLYLNLIKITSKGRELV